MKRKLTLLLFHLSFNADGSLHMARRLLLVAAISIFFIARVFSQAPEIEWQNTIGGNGGETVICILPTPDGGYIVGGYSNSDISDDKTEGPIGNYSFDYWVMKLDSSGAIEWENTIGGSTTDYLRAIQQTSEGGYIVGGYSNSNNSGDKSEASLGFYDYWVVELNHSGGIEWENTISGDKDDYLKSLEQTSDGGYILGGWSTSGVSGDKTEANLGSADYWVVKVSSTGTIEWQNTMGGSNSDFLNSLQQTSDGGYFLGGYSSSGVSDDKTESSQGEEDYWVVKLNNTGSIEWQNTIGGSNPDKLNSIRQTSEGGYILGGNSKSAVSGDKTTVKYGEEDYWAVKLDHTGAIEWQHSSGGSEVEGLETIRQTFDGGFILGGYSFSDLSGNKTEDSYGGYDWWVVKLNSAGTLEWQNDIGGNDWDFLFDIEQTPDGGYILGGHSYTGISGDKTEASLGGSDYWVVKLFPDVVCHSPPSLSTTGITSSSAMLTWAVVDGVEGYKVRYKVANTTDWTIKPALNTHKNIAELTANTEYAWQVKAVCALAPNITSEWSAKQFFSTTSLKSAGDISAGIFEVYPNPFASSTTITFSIEESSNILIELFDMAGRKLETILDEKLQAGSHEVNLDRRQLPAGMYVVKMKTRSSVATQSIIIQ